jgi:hypothetical protein
LISSTIVLNSLRARHARTECSQSWIGGGFGKEIAYIKGCNSHPNKHVNQNERVWGEKPGESLANGQPERMKIAANIAPDKIKEVYLTKAEVNHGSLLRESR